MYTSPSSGLLILMLASLLVFLGRNQGALRRLTETSVSSLQAVGGKLLDFPDWDAGSPTTPLYCKD
jgi:hypothetical protein